MLARAKATPWRKQNLLEARESERTQRSAKRIASNGLVTNARPAAQFHSRAERRWVQADQPAGGRCCVPAAAALGQIGR